MQFGRTPADLAFAAGNRAVFALLHEATQAAAAAVTAPEDTPDIPDPSEFWQYLQQQTAEPAATAGAAQAPLNPNAPAGQPARGTPETHPRKQFESWLGGILFPQRQRASTPAAAAGTPYGTVNQSAQPPPSLAKPAFAQMMKQAGPHKVGHAGGSQFAARRAQAQATAAPPSTTPAAAPATGAPVENVLLTLDPYEDEVPPQAPAAPGATVGAGGAGRPPENPLAAMMQAIGKKAQSDLKMTMDGVASMMSSLPPPTPAEKLREEQKKSGAAPALLQHTP